MAYRRDEAAPWPPKLAVFRVADWLEPGEVAARHTVLLCHHRWCAARLSMLTEGTPEHGAERLRGMRENVRMIRNPPKEGCSTAPANNNQTTTTTY